LRIPLNVILTFIVAFPVLGQSDPGEFLRESIGTRSYPTALRLAERLQAAPLATIPAAAEAIPGELDALRQWNAQGRLPLQNGISRKLEAPLHIRVGASTAADQSTQSTRGIVQDSSDSTVVWTGTFHVEGAHRVRLHLANARIPAEATLWVYGAGQAPIAFGPELVHEGSLYTPSVESELVSLEIEIPTPRSETGGLAFDIDDVVEIFAVLAAAQPEPDDYPSCLVDATCISTSSLNGIEALQRATALLGFVKNGKGYLCSGGLINAASTPEIEPYMLTANHCFDTQASASTLEAYWDYRTASCNGPFPSLPTPHLGATILATSPLSDFTFLRLNSLPGGRWLLGWDTNPVPNGRLLHRVSHPYPEAFSKVSAQRYSSSIATIPFGTCASMPTSGYLYSSGSQGGTYGGSSGSPVAYVSDGHIYIVGQLYGSCGANPKDGCDNATNYTVDGRLSVTYPMIQQYLRPTVTTCATCVSGANTACLLGNRFKVTMHWKDSFAGLAGTGNIIRYADNLPEIHPQHGPLSESAFFSMYSFSPKSIEVLVRMIKGANINNKYWVFLTGFAGAEYTVRVEDTQSCRTWTRFVAGGATNMTKDFDAFPFP
jgi:lysyl endopeptidase